MLLLTAIAMRNAEKLRNAMRLGRVYRRQDLEGFSTAVDRDLKTLVESGEVRKLAFGLYYRPKRNALGDAPPDSRELVRAFLKTGDFLLTSYNHFTDLGLGLTQVYNNYLVYNHKRSGDLTLDGRRFRFRLVPTYPKRLSKEYLLIDLLNNLKQLPDDAERVLRNLDSHLSEFDEGKVRENLAQYGRPGARAALKHLAAQKRGLRRREELQLRIVDKEDPRDDLQFWLGKSPAERIDAVEFLRRQCHLVTGQKALPRLARTIQLRDRHA